ncbi:hypothetical protein ACJMK2_033967 [Sinanodonta woodiana]|uniref:Fucosyltransferase n=1 Tax=Sinanodonta woodiana TaxID=1069815 RepID=A0ABD3WRX3_SINWO
MNSKRVKLTVVSLAIGLIMYSLSLLWEMDYTIKRPGSYQNVDYMARKLLRKNHKVINIWTEFDHDKFQYVTEVREYLLKCPHKCSVTNDPKDLVDSDAVFFHLTDLWIPNWEIGTKRTLPFPKESHPNQIWIIHNNEPPFSFFGNVDIFGDIFNWTMWYRSDATIYDPYGRAVNLDQVEKKVAREQYERRNIYSEKSKFMVGAVSNCKDAGRRYLLIDQMSTYLDIDMFGKCYGNTMCGTAWRDGNSDCDEVLRKYRFYLAFESSHCMDYVTEKYWYALDRHQIPVVNWKRKDLLSGYIPNSYINVYDFPSIKEFADFITIVNSNETLYNSYFEWRKQFTIDLTHRLPWCDTCERLHMMDVKYKPQTVNLSKYIDSDVCPPTTRREYSNVQKSAVSKRREYSNV